MKRLTLVAILATLLIALATAAGAADGWSTSDDRWCSENRRGSWEDRRTVRVCEVRQITLSPAVLLAVDGRQNGGIRVEGDDRSDILLRARVEAWAESRQQAVDLADRIAIETAGHEIAADGPQGHRYGGWSVSFEILVPRQIDLQLRTHNGGVSISRVEGDIRFDVLNGGVGLRELAGNVSGHTTNGGLHVTLDGYQWTGAGLDVRSTNGGVYLEIPEGYAADLETGTVNGRIDLGFPVTVQGSIGKSLRVALNGGGPLIRVKTTNGSVTLERP